MAVRVAYPDGLLLVEGHTVYLFKKRLYSAPLEEVLKAAYGDEAVLPPTLRRVSRDIAVLVEKGVLRPPVEYYAQAPGERASA